MDVMGGWIRRCLSDFSVRSFESVDVVRGVKNGGLKLWKQVEWDF